MDLHLVLWHGAVDISGVTKCQKFAYWEAEQKNGLISNFILSTVFLAWAEKLTFRRDEMSNLLIWRENRETNDFGQCSVKCR